MERKDTIRTAFSQAADGYEAAAQPQARAAALLARRLPPLASGARVLELGCGTGLMTRLLLEHLPGDGRLLATDLSLAMLEQAGRHLDDPRLALAEMDAETLPPALRGLDLIASSLAAQWFTDLPATLADLAGRLAPGGTLVLTTLGEGSFREWREALAHAGLASGIPDYPTPETLAALLPGATVERESFTQDYAQARDFPRALAAMGAATPKPGHRPAGAGALRRALAGLETPFSVTWEILILSYGEPS